MKRGKDEEKNMGPMFPRLHVNDTDKGGPRAPPRNKMALYEQLSIPSQRFNPSGITPLNPSNPSNLAPPASSSQASSSPAAHTYQSSADVSGALAGFPIQAFIRFTNAVYVNGCWEGLPGDVLPGRGPPEVMERGGEGHELVVVHPVNCEALHGYYHACRGHTLVMKLIWSFITGPEYHSCCTPKCVAYFLYLMPLQKLLIRASGNERGIYNPSQQPPAEKARTRYADSNTPLVHRLEQKKKPDEDDFSVPIFVQSDMGQDNSNKNSNSMDRQGLSPFSPAYSGNLTKFQKGIGEHPNQTETTGPRKQTNAPIGGDSFSRSQNMGDSLRRQYRIESQVGNTIQVGGGVANERIRGLAIDYRNSSVPVRDLQLEEQRSPNDTNGDDVSETSMLDSISGIDISPDDVVGIIGQKHFWKARKAIVKENEVILNLYILCKVLEPLPLGIIRLLQQLIYVRGNCGRYHGPCLLPILNDKTCQQRVFAVQVFELHRLMKVQVQRLIAGSPHLLQEDGAYVGKQLKAATAKKLPLEYIVKAPPKIAEQKVVSEKPNHTMECSAENIVGKASLSSVQNNSQPSNYGPFSGNPLATPTSNDSSVMGSWGFNQPPGHQWLIPVMSPSEGLVYKPYPGPGFMNPVCGGYGPQGPTPVMGNFLNYGVPPPPHHHYQGLGLTTPFTPPMGHGYFPPFGMPIMNPPGSGSVSEQGPNCQLSGGVSTFNVPYQGSCNTPSQKNRDASNPVKPHASKDSELQFSTASSPSERQGAVAHVGGGGATKGRNAATNLGGAATDGGNALPLFPTSPVAQVPEDAGPQTREADQVARVIRVVPHNARSATESVARIFQSIQEERKQEERKQYDSV
ncbi:hypothetical protein LguiB_027991 [Lonicera macranthoides]